jgi:hypothetical protein
LPEISYTFASLRENYGKDESTLILKAFCGELPPEPSDPLPSFSTSFCVRVLIIIKMSEFNKYSFID